MVVVVAVVVVAAAVVVAAVVVWLSLALLLFGRCLVVVVAIVAVVAAVVVAVVVAVAVVVRSLSDCCLVVVWLLVVIVCVVSVGGLSQQVEHNLRLFSVNLNLLSLFGYCWRWLSLFLCVFVGGWWLALLSSLLSAVHPVVVFPSHDCRLNTPRFN